MAACMDLAAHCDGVKKVGCSLMRRDFSMLV